MKRTVVALSVLGLALVGCGEQQSGNSNPDSQVEQPPLPDATEPRTQGPDDDQGPDADTSDPADDTGDDGSDTDGDTDTDTDG